MYVCYSLGDADWSFLTQNYARQSLLKIRWLLNVLRIYYLLWNSIGDLGRDIGWGFFAL